jgi:hypothetical protein
VDEETVTSRVAEAARVPPGLAAAAGLLEHEAGLNRVRHGKRLWHTREQIEAAGEVFLASAGLGRDCAKTGRDKPEAVQAVAPVDGGVANAPDAGLPLQVPARSRSSGRMGALEWGWRG